MKKFRKRISIKWILLPAVLAAAIVVPAAQAKPEPLQTLNGTTPAIRAALEELGTAASASPTVGNPLPTPNHTASTNVQAALEELGSAASSSGVKELGTATSGSSANHFLTGQVATVPVADEQQALYDRSQGGAVPGVNAAGLRYKALAHQATGTGTSFQWGDAATGFGIAIGLVILVSIAGFAVVNTRNRPAPA